MRKINIVIFSSGISEKNGTLDKVIKGLEAKGYDVFCWRDLFRDAHESTNIALLPMLIKKIPTFDFAVLIGESHDATTLIRKGNKVQVNSMRDNVVFEIGLSVMALGLKRVILLTDNMVRLPEDLTGLHGELAIKHIVWNDIDEAVENVDRHIVNSNISSRLFDDISAYINKQQNEISPVVIGASTSAAIGYTTNFVLRLLENIHHGFWNRDQFYPVDIQSVYMHIVIPETYDEDDGMGTKKDADLQEGILRDARLRPLSFKYRQIENGLHIYDYPTTLVTSYDTARMILDIYADDDDDSKARTRFYQKELDLFETTLRIILNEAFITEKVQSFYPMKTEAEQLSMIHQIEYIVNNHFYIERY